MNQLFEFFTQKYKDKDIYSFVKARHTFTMLMLILLSISVEIIFVLFLGEDKSNIILQDLIASLLFIVMLLTLKSGHLVLTGNLFIIAGAYKLIDYFPIHETSQFFLQCFLGLIVCVAIYVKKYQLYITLFETLVLAIVRIIYIQNELSTIGIDPKDFMYEIYQATAAVFVFTIIILFYDQIIKREIVNRKHLKHLSETDMLTSLLNRQSFNKSIDSLMKNHKNYCLALIDIDYFKNINDTYGHQIGDSVLQDFSQLLKKNVSNPHLLFRWGGEEFAVIFNDLDTPKGENPFSVSVELERLRLAVSKYTFTNNESITISIGYVCSEDFDHKDALLIHADRALYLAKKQGRNCIRTIGREALI